MLNECPGPLPIIPCQGCDQTGADCPLKKITGNGTADESIDASAASRVGLPVAKSTNGNGRKVKFVSSPKAVLKIKQDFLAVPLPCGKQKCIKGNQVRSFCKDCELNPNNRLSAHEKKRDKENYYF
ncbi:MAG TPA: hypothetical protein VMD74_00475 [Candidatus Methylomirabilis sp.]|nr:hypothetical protein [Candidatus Methylomirabilis sp.]